MKADFFMPEYMKEFRCIGPKCKDTCCAGWDINIDEDTYKKYSKDNGELKDLVAGKYTKNNKEHDFFNAAFMNLVGEKECPFLNKEKLCNIHGGLGEENLCITCKSYPRVYNIVDDIYEKSGLPSCEEVCRLAFLNKDKMEFIEIEEEIDEDCIEIRRIIDTESFMGTESLIQYFWNLRIITIAILQNREYSIEERLNILSAFYDKIEQHLNAEEFAEIDELIEESAELNFDEFLKLGQFNEEEVYLKLKNKSLIENIKSSRLKKLAQNYLEMEKVENYLNNNDKIEATLAGYSYIYENYLVNQVFKDLIPINKVSLSLSIKRLRNSFIVIKCYLAALMITRNNEIDEEDILSIIQCFSKDAEHNKVFDEILE